MSRSAQAKRAERLLTDDDDAATRMKVLEAVAEALLEGRQAQRGQAVSRQYRQARSSRLRRVRQDSPLQARGVRGPQGQERSRDARGSLHRGGCPPCAAVDLAFDGLMKAYKPTDAILHPVPHPRPGPGPAHQPRFDEARSRSTTPIRFAARRRCSSAASSARPAAARPPRPRGSTPPAASRSRRVWRSRPG